MHKTVMKHIVSGNHASGKDTEVSFFGKNISRKLRIYIILCSFLHTILLKSICVCIYMYMYTHTHIYICFVHSFSEESVFV